VKHGRAIGADDERVEADFCRRANRQR
jgi:hypothetical protein